MLRRVEETFHLGPARAHGIDEGLHLGGEIGDQVGQLVAVGEARLVGVPPGRAAALRRIGGRARRGNGIERADRAAAGIDPAIGRAQPHDLRLKAFDRAPGVIAEPAIDHQRRQPHSGGEIVEQPLHHQHVCLVVATPVSNRLDDLGHCGVLLVDPV